MKKITILFSLIIYTTFVNAQNVGIGTTTPNFPLSFPNTLGDKISLWGTTGNHYGVGVQSGLLQIHSDASFAHIGFGFGSSSNFTERMRIINEGEYGMALDGRIILRNGTSPLNPAAGGGVWMYKGDNSGLLGLMGVQNNQNIGFYGGSEGWGFTYDAINSRVGIGNVNPANKLDVGGDINLTGKIKINGNTGTAGQILKSNGASTSSSWENMQYKQVLFSSFLTGNNASTIYYSPVSQSSFTNTTEISLAEFVMPYSGKIVAITIRATTTSSISGLPSNIRVTLFKNGSPTFYTLNFASPWPVSSSATFTTNFTNPLNFSAGDRICYETYVPPTNTSVRLNSALSLIFE